MFLVLLQTAVDTDFLITIESKRAIYFHSFMKLYDPSYSYFFSFFVKFQRFLEAKIAKLLVALNWWTSR